MDGVGAALRGEAKSARGWRGGSRTMANAIYTVVSETGRCFQLRADTEDTYKTLLYLGKSTFNEEIVDVVDEIRAKSEDDGDFCVSPYLGLGEDHKEIPNLFKARSLVLMEEAMDRLAERLSSGELVLEESVEVELVEVPEEIEVPEETISQLAERLSSGEVGVEEPVEVGLVEEPVVLEEPIKVPEILVEEVRPRVNIKVIEGLRETEDHSSLFDE